MNKLCSKPEHQDACLQIGSLVVLVASLFLLPGIWLKLFYFAMTPYGQLAVLATFGAGLTVRYKNYQWAKNRRFSDGIDWTPDLYLYNSGDGTGPGIRAHMPEVKGASLLTPWSWLFGVKLRKVAIMLKDGRMSFPWVPTRALASPAETLKCINVPQDYQITGAAAVYLQAKYAHIKRSVGKMARSEQDQEFMLFADVLFTKDSWIDFLAEVTDNGPDIALLTGAIMELNTRIASLGVDARNVASSVNSVGSRVTSQGTKITSSLAKIFDEVASDVLPAPAPEQVGKKKKKG